METRDQGSRESALRPLRAAADAVALLRSGPADPEPRRDAVLRITVAVEESLRRLLRDDGDAPLDLRLRALARDEMPAEALIAELRQRDRVSIEFAAAFHELLAVSRRLESGAQLAPGNAELALRVVERLQRDVERGTPPVPPPVPVASAAPADPFPPDAAAEEGSEPPSRRRSAPPPYWIWAAGGLGLVLLVALGVWLTTTQRGGGDLAQGVALFRSGAYEQAAPHFQRHAERNPEDPTPRLYLARIHRRTGNFSAAAEDLRYAIEIAPEDAGIHRELGFLLLDIGRADAAVPRFRTAIELDPAATDGWVGLVRALRVSGQAAAAERVLARAPAEVRALAR